MSITAKQFNKAFAEFQIFGPRRRIPVRTRWQEMFPDLDSREIGSMEAQCKEIEAFALGLAEKAKDNGTSIETSRKQLAQKYPVLDKERLDHTWSQAMYFSAK